MNERRNPAGVRPHTLRQAAFIKRKRNRSIRQTNSRYHTRPYEETLRDEVEWLVRTGKVKAAAQGKHAAAHA